MKLRLVALLAMLALVVGACAAPAPATPAPPTPAPPAPDTPAPDTPAPPTEVPTEPPEAVTLRVWVRDYMLNQDAPFETAKAAFEAMYPHVTIEITGYPYDPLYESVLLSKAGTVKPDVFQPDAYWIGQMAQEDLSANLDAYVADWDGLADVPERFRENMQSEGSYYGIWTHTDLRLFIWNKDIFRQAGLDPETPPRTWDEMIAMGQQIKENVPGVVPIGFPAAAQEATTDRFLPLLYMARGDILNEDRTEAIFNSPEGVQAVQLLVDLVHTYELTPIAVLGQGHAEVRDSVLSGLTAMMISNNGTGVENADLPPDEYREKFGAAPIPICDGCQPATTSGGYHLSIHYDSPNKDLAWEFIQLSTEPENMMDFFIAQRRIPTRGSVLEQTDRLSQDNPYFSVVAEAVQTTVFQPFIPEYFAIEETIYTAIQRAVQDGGNVQEHLDTAVAAANALLNP